MKTVWLLQDTNINTRIYIKETDILNIDDH